MSLKKQTLVLVAVLTIVLVAATDYAIGVQVAHACGMVNNGTGKPGGMSGTTHAGTISSHKAGVSGI